MNTPEDYAAPVAVIVTEPVPSAPRPGRSFTTGTTTLTATPERVANDVPTRRRVTVTATGGAAGQYVTLGRSQALTGPTTGYRLPSGESLTIEAAGEVWAASADGLAVSVYAEYTDGGA